MPNSPLTNPQRAELSESKYRRYESVFLEFLDVYPAPFMLKPVAGALTTHVVRIREAANAVLCNSHLFVDPILINLDNFREAWKKIKVSIRGEPPLIYLAEPGTLAEISRIQVVEAPLAKPLFTISNPTLAELNAFASLVQRRAAPEPFLFIGEVPPFLPPIGVAFEQTPEGWIMI